MSRDLAEMGNRMNLQQRPLMGREEFEARKVEMIRKRENERYQQHCAFIRCLCLSAAEHVKLVALFFVCCRGNVLRDGEKSRMMNNSAAASSSPMKPKSVCIIIIPFFIYQRIQQVFYTCQNKGLFCFLLYLFQT